MANEKDPVKVGSRTPWGKADSVSEIADGIFSVGTPGHGGLKLSREKNAQMPSFMRNDGGWYEEDCEWSKVALVFPTAFPEAHVLQADQSCRDWFPDEYQQFTGTVLEDDRSHILSERRFRERHKDDYVVKAAFGDWKEGVPSGMVGVVAALGSRKEGDEDAWFLVPDAEYEQRGKFGFVIDLARHKKISKLQ